MPDPTPDTAAADLGLLRRAAAAELIDGFRQAVNFLAKVEEATNLDLSTAYDELSKALGRALFITG